ncbi:hypothetical protein B0T26DRAFT_768119 [Lasiosphaeria miniovina]|uniref:DUF6536 domain-containing protein n=1 Tax=Lasiosphaeria miniovina TaxID=1954250 RepID=A0AA40B732_9PEZI|nr:uncharacterized protein B0T26DRAFT_768119 [Lasiosphaeria miniovina]KAK0728498.1 hypothetical protein B0T26DRAFT_768119 [Lasiosphaeria miniovina]
MEIVIPPRDHGPSTFRYTWDENGEVQQMTRVREPSAIPNFSRLGRRTAQWPFESISDTDAASSPATPAFLPQIGTWQPQPTRDYDTDSVATEKNLIPDYVINYIRGETPETVAQRKLVRLGQRGVDIEHQNELHQSRVPDIDGSYLEHSGRPRSPVGHGGDEEADGGPGGGWRRLSVGWRAGVALNTLLSFLILVAGFVCLVVAIAKASVFQGRSVIFSGSCSTTSSISWVLHAVLSVFGIIIIAGANYVFSVLSSPTRAEVDVAHQKKKWLDIGVPSLRNLGHIDNTRTCLALILLLSAVVTQLMYNAVLFTSQTAPNFKLALVAESFLDGAPFSNGTANNSGLLSRFDLLSLQQQASRDDLVNLTASDCFQEFKGAFGQTFDAALLITNTVSQTNSLLQTSTGAAGDALTRIFSTSNPPLDQASVRYCMAQPGRTASTCEVDLNGALLGVVALLNLITVVAAAAVLYLSKTSAAFQPLATLGDAIGSFLQRPDPTTRGSCLMSKADVRQGRWGLQEAKYYVAAGDHYWFRSPSLAQWLFAVLAWSAPVGLAAAALAISVAAEPGAQLSAFGAVSAHSLVVLLPVRSVLDGPATAALLAALPHLLVAVLYFAANGLATACYLSHESSLFAAGHARPLRLSAGSGANTSLYLTLPRPVSWLLMAVFAGLDFVLSQGFFATTIRLVDVSTASPDPVISATATGTTLRPDVMVAALALSGVALLVLVAALALLALCALAVVFFCRAEPAGLVNGRRVGNPMALPGGSCSAVVSARCHPHSPGGDSDGVDAGVWRKPLVWGVVHEAVGMDVSRCAFTAGKAGLVDVARSYA